MALLASAIADARQTPIANGPEYRDIQPSQALDKACRKCDQCPPIAQILRLAKRIVRCLNAFRTAFQPPKAGRHSRSVFQEGQEHAEVPPPPAGHIKKYSPTTNNPEAYYGLPQSVLYCHSCVISNQRPNSSVEFKHTRDSAKATIHLDDHGICDACRLAEEKQRTIDWKVATASCANCATSIARTTAATTASCQAPAARTASTPRMC